MKTRLSLLLVGFLHLAGTPAAADTWTVGPPGAGADFDAVMTAFDAVSDGDTLVLLAGTYLEVFDFDRPMRIVGVGSDDVTLWSVGHSKVEVHGIDAGEELVLSGVAIQTSPTFPGDNPYGFFVGPNGGTVVFHDVKVESEGSVVQDTGRFLFLSSFVSGDPVNSLGESAALRVSDSTLWISSSEIVGGPGDSLYYDFGPGNRGLRAIRSTVHIARSRVVGGYGALGALAGLPAPVGGAALRADFSTILAYGGAGSEFVGGAGGTVGSGPGIPVDGGPALDLAFGSVFVVQCDIPVHGGLSVDDVEAPAVELDANSILVPYPLPFPTLDVTPAGAVAGDTVRLELTGAPGALAFPYVALTTGPTLTLPGVLGSWLLPVGAAQPLPAMALDAAGVAWVALKVPVAPALAGRTLFFQWVQFDGATLAIALPDAVTLLP